VGLPTGAHDTPLGATRIEKMPGLAITMWAKPPYRAGGRRDPDVAKGDARHEAAARRKRSSRCAAART
jgi:hypothetical protein